MTRMLGGFFRLEFGERTDLFFFDFIANSSFDSIL